MTDAAREAHDRLPDVDFPDKPEGPIAAAVIAGGIGAAALGFFTTLAEISERAKSWLDWESDVGPLSGKTGMAVIIWLISWAVLYLAYRGKAYETRRAFTIALVLIGIGAVGTFPTFFEAFAD